MKFLELTLFKRLDKHMERHNAKPAGACLALIDKPEQRLKGKPYELEVATPVESYLAHTQNITLKTLAAVPLAASLLHCGSDDTLATMYRQLLDWLNVNGSHIAGASREIYLRMCDVATLYPDVYLTKEPDDYLTEVQLPIAKVRGA